MSKRTVLSSDDIRRAITRISHEILEQNRGFDDLLLLGIPTRGVLLANRIAAVVKEHTGEEVSVGSLDVTLYRDDLSEQPIRTVGSTTIPTSGVTGKAVVLVDDVLFSGRTVRAALDALNDHGRPKVVRLAALIDRGHRQLPIRADYVGKNLPTALSERVSVRIYEVDGQEEVVIED